jgi:aldehyde decarbonylase
LQGEELNRNGELYIRRYPKLKLNLVDGSSLVVAVVLNSIPKGTTQVLLRGNLTKVAYAIANTLCERDIKVRFNCRILVLKSLGVLVKLLIAMFIYNLLIFF